MQALLLKCNCRCGGAQQLGVERIAAARDCSLAEIAVGDLSWESRLQLLPWPLPA